jgi:hypothetical protein
MANKRPLFALAAVLVILISLASFVCGLFFFPAFSILAPLRTATSTTTPSPTATLTATASPLPPIYVTLNVNEFATYTIYWKRELWEDAIGENAFTEDFENDRSDYGELNFPYLTGNGFLLNGDSSAQIFNDNSLLSSGNLIHFRDWGSGLRFSFPNNSVASAFSFDYKASETWQLAFNDSIITIPKGTNRFIGVVIHNFFPSDFLLSSFESVQGGLSVDNISYIPIANVTAVPSPTSGNVTITAAGGNINIRRGPRADYNLIGAFLNGQASIATGRNENGTWLYIPIPGAPDEFGWVNATTRLSRVTGNINLIPVIVVEPPEPAYVRNCTANPMLLKPGDIRIENRLSSPNNVTLIFPGDYEVYDTTIAGSLSIKVLLVREGKTIDIEKDGLNKTYSCL